MTRTSTQRSDEAGFTLVELMVVVTILVVGVLGVLTLLDGANRATWRTKAREAGTNLARETIEAARAVPYPDVMQSIVTQRLQAQPGLASTTAGSAWTVKRRNITYTLSASVCTVDDPADGYGNRPAGSDFCAGPTGTADPAPDDYKRLAVTASWKDGTQTRSVRQEAIINNPGSTFAPAVKQLAASSTLVTDPATTQVNFTATTSIKPELGVKWFLDNVEKGSATPVGTSGTTWSFSWTGLGSESVSDGTYLVRAQAYDEYGQSGKTYTVSIVLNRYAPAPPTGFLAGRNPLWNDRVEFEWNPSSERDILGYRIYRIPAGATPSTSDTDVVCETAVGDRLPTTCIAEPEPEGGPFSYYVVAVAPARPPATGVEESARPANAQPVMDNSPPSAPATVTVGRDDSGVTLTWPAAIDADGTIRYYRIYRDDNSSWKVRFDRTPSGTSLSYTDPTGTAGSRYWVTAVDNVLAESPFAPSPIGIVAP